MVRLTDEIVDEIHAVRLQHAASFNNDMDKILDDLAASQQSRVARGWLLVKSAETPADLPGASLQRTRFTQRFGLLRPS